MLELYWGCLIGGVLFSLVTILLSGLGGHDGQIGGHGHDGHLGGHDAGTDHTHHLLDFLNPAVVVGGIATFGGAGVLLTRYAAIAIVPTVLLAITIALVMMVAVYALYIRPMRNVENSTGFSMKDTVGHIGEVMTTVPAVGFGEVMIRFAGGSTCQIAASADARAVSAGTAVVIVAVEGGVVYVTPVDELTAKPIGEQPKRNNDNDDPAIGAGSETL